MCATTPIDCRECGEPLYVVAGRRAECRNGHIAGSENLSTPGSEVTSQYHANGRSLAMLRTVCARCRSF